MIYLDHNATSPLRASARGAMLRALDEAGNASSVHGAGRLARAMIEDARDKVAKFAGAPRGAVVFTSGGGEANALALRGAIAAAAEAGERITRLFVLSIAHDGVRANAAALAESEPGIRLSEIPVTSDGVIDLAAFRTQLINGKGRALVSVMAASNETGVIQPIEEIAKLVRAEGGEDALLHVDAVAAAGRMPIRLADWHADYLSLSAHKIGGPQGAGALIVRAGAPLSPLFAGAQEMRRRGGTENVAAIAGFGAAAEEATRDRNDLTALRDRFESELRMIVPSTVIFGENAPRIGNTTNFAIPGLTAETALIALDLDGVCISSGSACASGTVKPSHVLAAMVVPESLARCGLRVSLGWNTRDQDINAALASLNRLLARTSRAAAA
jgi:cysteine desulfurase